MVKTLRSFGAPCHAGVHAARFVFKDSRHNFHA